MRTGRTLLLSVLFGIFVLGISKTAVSHEQTAAALHIEGTSIASTAGTASRQVTISFRIVNDGAAIRTPFRTVIFADSAGKSLSSSFVTTKGLEAGETLYASSTISVPERFNDFDVRIAADVDGALSVANPAALVVVAHQTFFPPLPGRWFSLGPRLITAPPVPELGLGEYKTTGRLGPIAVDPSDNLVIYVSTSGAGGHEGCGVWKTKTGGQFWSPMTDSLPTTAVAAIAIDPTKTDRVYIATPDFGIFRSEDGGTSWKNVEGDLHVRRNIGHGDRTVIVINPKTPNVLYATSDDGVYRSDNFGDDWKLSLNTRPIGGATSLVMDPLDPLVLYAGVQNWGIFKTTVGGVSSDPNISSDLTWNIEPLPAGANFSPTYGIQLAIQRQPASAPETVYALLRADEAPPAGSSPGYALWRKVGGGVWEKRYECSPDDGSDCNFTQLTVNPAAANWVFLAGATLRISPDGGGILVRVPDVGLEDRLPDAPHGDYHGFAFDPDDNTRLFAATDGGVYVSSFLGVQGTWSFIGQGITNAEMYDLAQAKTLPSRLIAGTQDNGTIRFDGNTESVWDHIHPEPQTAPPPPGYCAGCGGDGGLVDIDPTNENVLYVMGQLSTSIEKSAAAGVLGSYLKIGLFPGLPPSCNSYNSTFHFQVQSSSPTTVLAACVGLFRLVLGGSQWTPLFFPPGGFGVRLATDPNQDLDYLGTREGQVFGPGPTGWTELFQRSAELPVSDIEVDPAHPEIIYASFAAFPVLDRPCNETIGRVYQIVRGSSDVRGATASVRDITGNLPQNVCVNSLAIDPHVPRTIYAGTTRGVYRGIGPASSAQPWQWTEYMDGMPRADVVDLEVHRATNKMVAGTFGRGAFEVKLSGVSRRVR